MSNAYEMVKRIRSSNRLRAKEVIERLFRRRRSTLRVTGASGIPKR